METVVGEGGAPLAKDSSIATLIATLAAGIPVTVSPGTSRTATGTLAALNDKVTISAQNAGVIGISLVGTFVGTVSFEGSVKGDYSDTAAILATPAGVGGVPVTSTTSAGSWTAEVGGYTSFRVNFSSRVSGSMTASLAASTTSTDVTIVDSVLPTGAAKESGGNLDAISPALSLLSQLFGTQHAEDIGGSNTKVGSVIATNKNASIRYLLLSKTTDARTDASALTIEVAPSTIATFDTAFFGARGWSFGAHLSYAWSTGPAGSYGAATAADHDVVIMGSP